MAAAHTNTHTCTCAHTHTQETHHYIHYKHVHTLLHTLQTCAHTALTSTSGLMRWTGSVNVIMN